MSVSSTQGKLEVLRRHYEELGKVSVDDNFEVDWKEEVAKEGLQKLINVVHGYCNKWRLKGDGVF